MFQYAILSMCRETVSMSRKRDARHSAGSTRDHETRSRAVEGEKLNFSAAKIGWISFFRVLGQLSSEEEGRVVLKREWQK